MNAEIWFFFTPDGKHEITVLDKESAVEVAHLMSPDQRRQWKCRRNRSQDSWFVQDCHDLGNFEDHSKPRHAPVQPEHHLQHSQPPVEQHNAASNEEAMGNYLNDIPTHSPQNQQQHQSHNQQWQPPQGQNNWQAPQAQQPVHHAPPPVQPPQHYVQQPVAPRQPKSPTFSGHQQPPVAPPHQPQAHQPQQPPQWQAPQAAAPMPPPAYVAPQARHIPAAPPPAPIPMTEVSAGGHEKRRHQRIGLRLRVVLIAGNRSFRTYSKDVSKGGMSFEHIVPKELIGQDCKVIIGSSDMKENLEFEAHIAGDANNPRAVEFHNAKDEFRRKLDTWLADAKKNAA